MGARTSANFPTTPFAAAQFIVLVLALLTFATSVALADRGGFVIREFSTDLEIQPNSDVLVTENLTVDFSSPRHGIYRTIPYAYTDPKGYRYSFGFRLLEVVDEQGRAYGTQVSRSGSYYEIRIGDADREVDGRVVYKIRYRVERALGRFPEHDELYWNATGNEWQTTIERARTTVHLPVAFTADSLETAGYTGSFGSREQSVEISYPRPGEVEFEATRQLQSLEGLTVAVAWPRGHVARPGALARMVQLARDNWILLAPFLWFAFLIRRYRAHGKDPAGAGSVVVRYEPPSGLTPAEIGTIIDERVDLRDITATVVDLAVRGFLTIREDEKKRLFGLVQSKETVFVRAQGADRSKLLIHEQKVFDGIFEHGDEVETKDLRERFYKEIDGIRTAVHERLVELGSFQSSPRSVRNRWVGFGVLAGAITFLVGLANVKLTGGIFPNAILAPIVAAVPSTLLFFAFSRAMPRRTAKGVAEREWALGFQEFVVRAEADRIERELADGRNARDVFERLLPYAMALGVASAWARRFRDLYTYDSAPVWYVGSGGMGSFSPISLEQNLTSSMESVGRTMVSSPRSSGSSGSGGGGFSGGGGGGGGGGSW